MVIAATRWGNRPLTLCSLCTPYSVHMQLISVPVGHRGLIQIKVKRQRFFNLKPSLPRNLLPSQRGGSVDHWLWEIGWLGIRLGRLGMYLDLPSNGFFPTPVFAPLLIPLFPLFLPNSAFRRFLNLRSDILCTLSSQSRDPLHCRSPTEYTSNPTTTSPQGEHKHSEKATYSLTFPTSRTFLERRASTQ